MIKAILFDLDDTLIQDEQVSLEAFREAASLAGSGVDGDRLARDAGAEARRLWRESPYIDYCTRIGHSAWEGLWARYEYPDNEMTRALREWTAPYRVASWQAALAEQGAADEALAARMAQRFFEARRRYPRFAEIDGLLEALRGRYLLGIVTNGVPDLQREKINGCGIAHLFNAAVASGEIDCGKPDPGIFRHICAELGVQPAECVMVGDNPERDVAGAIAVGMKSVFVSRGFRPRNERFPADLECDNLNAMLPWLANQ